jgi:DNA polymerase-3 subunit epsilon
MVRVIDGKVESSFDSFIKPPSGYDYFDSYNTMIHGITEEDVEGAPELPDLLPQISDYVGDLPLVAHYAAFDTGVIRDCLDVYGMDWPTLNYFCTVVLSRRVVDLVSYSLPYVADEFDVSLDGHHKADVDALACAEIALGLMGRKDVSSLDALAETTRVAVGNISPGFWSGCHSRGDSKNGLSPERIAELQSLIGNGELNLESDVAGQVVVFTGTLGSMTRAEAWARVQAVGGLAEKSVTKKTNMLVFGVQDPSHLKPGFDNSSKFLKAQELKTQGHPIEVLDELSFLRMIMSG